MLLTLIHSFLCLILALNYALCGVFIHFNVFLHLIDKATSLSQVELNSYY